ncbi:DUF4394 domain-containing protein [Alishewanella sp. d11]|uniref:DUF4394 domain-containing protein n=1 Tax=Alishewanella sp. d11 TaxID=3414030 RepID=UPI003BF881B1
MKLSLVASVILTASLVLPVTASSLPTLKGNEQLWLLTASQQLLKINPSKPDNILAQTPLTGLAEGERLTGIDYRVAYGVLFALSNKGQLYTIDTETGQLTAVGTGLASGTLQDAQYGFDFNPAADRIRVVNAAGQNLRLHPETGALAFTDPDLQYAATDSQAGVKPTIVAAAYTYNQQDIKLTTNYAIDQALGTLVTQGSVEGTEPVISPNTGQLFTVGSLGIANLQQVSFDISDLTNLALLAVTTSDEAASILYQLDLTSGTTYRLGVLAQGEPLVGLAIEP